MASMSQRRVRKKRPLNKAEHLQMRAVIQAMTKEKASYQAMQARLVELFGEKSPSASTVKHWRKVFAFGERSLQDKPRNGRPVEASTPHIIDLIKRMVAVDDTITDRTIASMVGISPSTVLRTLRDRLGMKRRNRRWIPQHLSDEEGFLYVNPDARKETMRDILADAGISLDNVNNDADLNQYLRDLENQESRGSSPSDHSFGKVIIKEEPQDDDPYFVAEDYGIAQQDHSAGSLTIAEAFSLSHPEEMEMMGREDKSHASLQSRNSINGNSLNSSGEGFHSSGNLPKERAVSDQNGNPIKYKGSESISSYEQALSYLKPLEQFALLIENIRVVGLISHIETIFQNKLEAGNP